MVVDGVRAKSFLAERLGNEVVDVTAMGQGAWSTAYFFHRGAGDYVIRFSPLAEDFTKDRIAGRYRAPKHNFDASPKPGRRISATEQSGPSPPDLPPPFEPWDDDLDPVGELAVSLFRGRRVMAEGP